MLGAGHFRGQLVFEIVGLLVFRWIVESGGMPTATIIGSGPNGLSAAIVLAASGIRTTVLERNGQIGDGCSTAEVTQPGFLHDLGS
jgi:NADPH-dependent 2,4-dienoyl-CoA reductase/sulfur reductase-like enzyme